MILSLCSVSRSRLRGVPLSWSGRLGGALAAALLAASASASAQQPQVQIPPPPPSSPSSSPMGGMGGVNGRPGGNGAAGAGKLLYRRETLDYPDAGRPDPMQPPSSLAQTGGEIKLLLAGIVYNRAEPKKSQAMIRWAETPVGGASSGAAGQTERRVVQIGDSIDVYRVVRIRETSVELQVAALGGDRTIVLERERERKGSGSLEGGRRRPTGTRVTEQEIGATPSATGSIPPSQQPPVTSPLPPVQGPGGAVTVPRRPPQ